MNKIAIGPLLRQIAREKNLSVIQLANSLEKARQQVHQDFNRVEMKDDVIEKYAQALGIPKEEIYERWKGKHLEISHPAPPDLLSEQITRIEKMFQEQIEAKDRQIEALNRIVDNNQRIIDTLLGKSEGVSSGPSASRKKLLLPGSFYDTFGHTQVTA